MINRPRTVVQCAVFMTLRSAYNAWPMTRAICRRGFEDDGRMGGSFRVNVSAADGLVKNPVNVLCNSLKRDDQYCLLFAICCGFC